MVPHQQPEVPGRNLAEDVFLLVADFIVVPAEELRLLYSTHSGVNL
jgi:hypothetical protein